MKKNRIFGHSIALAGIGAAISLGAVIASFYIQQVSITLNIIAVVGIMLPLSKEYYKEAILAYAATCLLGGIFANIHILSFVFGGAYAIYTVMVYNQKIKLHIVICWLIKIAYAIFVFFIMYYLAKVFVINFEKLNTIIDLSSNTKVQIYVMFNIIFVILFILYDIGLIFMYKLTIKTMERVLPTKGNKSKEDKIEDGEGSPYGDDYIEDEEVSNQKEIDIKTQMIIKTSKHKLCHLI